MRWLGVVLAACLLAPAAAQAQDEASVLRLAEGCTAKSAYGQPFGSDQIVGRTGVKLANSVFATPGAAWAGFDNLEVVVTDRTKRIHTVTASLTFPNADEAEYALDNLLENLNGHPSWDFDDEADGDVLVLKGSTEKTGVQLELFQSGAEVGATCIERSLQLEARREFFEPPPTPTSRPAPPALEKPPQLLASACEGPAADGDMPDVVEAQVDTTTVFLRAANEYAQSLALWKAKRMVDQGVWTEQQRARRFLEILQNPRFLALQQVAMAELMGMLTDVDKVLGSRERNANCRVLIGMMGRLDRLSTNVMAQWKLIDDLYEAEAATKGVTLD